MTDHRITRRKALAFLSASITLACAPSQYSLAASPNLASPMKRLVLPGKTPKRSRPMPLVDADGQSRTTSDYRGRFLLVNIWATWCYPCRIEMPDLNRLQTKFDPTDLLVMPVSIDRSGRDAVATFYARYGIRNLDIFATSGAAAVNAFGERTIPFTILLNPDGIEIGRILGPAKWSSDDFVTYLETEISNWKTNQTG